MSGFPNCIKILIMVCFAHTLVCEINYKQQAKIRLIGVIRVLHLQLHEKSNYFDEPGFARLHGSKRCKTIPDEFLMDERVIDKPWLLRTILVKGIIVPFRAPKSAEAYKSIWTEEGSPLIVISKQQKDALQEMSNRTGNHCHALWNAFAERSLR